MTRESETESSDSKNTEASRRVRGRVVARAGVAIAVALMWGAVGCHKTSAQDPAAFSYQNSQQNAGQQDGSGDPQNGNLAPADTVNEAQQQADQYGQQGAPIERRYPGADSAPPPPQNAYADGSSGPSYDPNAADQAATDQAQAVYEADLTDEEATDAPPPLPDYEQPMAPYPDYIWTPGYWAWSPYGYYWVPGAWVEPPYIGALWTPGYWAFYGGGYRFHHGYWGLHIGFYGGINYGYGYTGYGYYGGYWRDNHFYYNRVVNRIDVHVVNRVYDYRIREDRFAGRPSFNGPRGITVQPRPAEIAVFRERRYAPMPAQVQLREQSMQNRQQFYNQNHGRPVVTVAAHPVASNHQMPAQLPQTAWQGRGQGDRQGRGGFQSTQPAMQPGQAPQIQPNPQGRVMPQQGRQTFGGQVQGQPGSQIQQPDRGQFRQRQQGAPQSQPQVQQQIQAQPQSQPQVQDYRRGRWQQTTPAQPQAQPQPQPQQQPQQQFRRGPEGSRMSSQPPQPQQPQAQPQQEFRRGPEGARMSAPAPAAPRAQPQPQAPSHPQPQNQSHGDPNARGDRGHGDHGR